MLVLTETDITTVMQEVIDLYLIPKFNELNMNASGEWLESLETESRQDTTGVIRGQDYSQYLARGRRPNQNQDPIALRNWAVYFGRTVIKDWADAKGITIPPIAIAYKIARDGTTWHEKGGSDLLEVLTSSEVIGHIEKRFIDIATVRVKNTFERKLKEIF